MDWKLIVLLVFIGVASAKELTAYQTGLISFSGGNCGGGNTPNPITISFLVHNPSVFPLSISYKLYDPNTNSYLPGDNLSCAGGHIPPNGVSSCTLQAYTMTGGSNGTSNVEIVLLGANEVDNYSKLFDIQVSSHTSTFEINVLSKLQNITAGVDNVANPIGKNCYGSSCCGMIDANNNLYLALSNLSAANVSLKECKLSYSWNYLMNASAAITSANESYTLSNANCTKTISLISDTAQRIASTAQLIAYGKKCGADVSLSELQLTSANSSLVNAIDALPSDGYGFASSRLSDANISLQSAINSIGKCPVNTTIPTPPANQSKNQSSNQSPGQTSLGGNSLLIVAGVLVGALILAIAAFSILTAVKTGSPKKEELPKPPPAQPPAVQEDLEKEFNEWLESHSQKK